jgi:hypothetical protein
LSGSLLGKCGTRYDVADSHLCTIEVYW